MGNWLLNWTITALFEAAITSKTRAVCVVHYAGVACEMDEILAICQRYELALVEDAAQGVLSFYKGRALGSIGDYGALSFHETKKIISGEGGALLVNSEFDAQQAEIIRDKGPCMIHPRGKSTHAFMIVCRSPRRCRIVCLSGSGFHPGTRNWSSRPCRTP